jgi:hypothetical protein
MKSRPIEIGSLKHHPNLIIVIESWPVDFWFRVSSWDGVWIEVVDEADDVALKCRH